jgi:hypothetical protein
MVVTQTTSLFVILTFVQEFLFSPLHEPAFLGCDKADIFKNLESEIVSGSSSWNDEVVKPPTMV